MAGTCANCKRGIPFQGVQHGRMRFCGQKCMDAAAVTVTQNVPQQVIDESVRRVHDGACPVCKGPGPVDIHRHFTVFSAIILTRWTTQSRVCCRKCAVKDQLFALGKAIVLGWWGIPWGLIITPIQFVRNVIGLVHPPDPAAPSRRLESSVRFRVAENMRLSQKWDAKPQGAAA